MTKPSLFSLVAAAPCCWPPLPGARPAHQTRRHPQADRTHNPRVTTWCGSRFSSTNKTSAPASIDGGYGGFTKKSWLRYQESQGTKPGEEFDARRLHLRRSDLHDLHRHQGRPRRARHDPYVAGRTGQGKSAALHQHARTHRRALPRRRRFPEETQRAARTSTNSRRATGQGAQRRAAVQSRAGVRPAAVHRRAREG